MKERNYKIAEKDNEFPLGKMFSFALIIEKAMYIARIISSEPCLRTPYHRNE